MVPAGMSSETLSTTAGPFLSNLFVRPFIDMATLLLTFSPPRLSLGLDTIIS